MRCSFENCCPKTMFENLSIGQAFYFKDRIFLLIEDLYPLNSETVCNTINLETGEGHYFPPDEIVTPCELNGVFKPSYSINYK